MEHYNISLSTIKFHKILAIKQLHHITFASQKSELSSTCNYIMQMVNESNAPAPLSMAVVPQSFLNGLMDEVREVKSLLQKKSEEEVNSQWIESTQVRKRLGISAKTWQTYRDERRIPFSQFGRKIYVKRADLEKFMEDHYIDTTK